MAISNGQLEGFPSPHEVKTAYLALEREEFDGGCTPQEYVLAKDEIREMNIEADEVRDALAEVGFSMDMMAGQVAALSGGWRMKLALVSAMLSKADILLLDEPTNHLDVNNVAWLEKYLCDIASATSIIVSHDSGFLDRVCTHITHYEENRKLKTYKGNLAEFVRRVPAAKAY